MSDNPLTNRLIQAQAHAEAQPQDIRLVLWRDGVEVDISHPVKLVASTRRVAWAEIEQAHTNPIIMQIDALVSEFAKLDN